MNPAPTPPIEDRGLSDLYGAALVSQDGREGTGVGRGAIQGTADWTPVTADQMRKVDRIAAKELRIGLLPLMENAATLLAELAVRRFAPARVTVLAGTGGNGGAGLAAARHLANRGISISLTLVREPAPRTAAAHQLDVARCMGLPVTATPADADLVIDALIGYGLSGRPAGRASGLIGWANQQPTPILALDIPSGLDATTGMTRGPHVKANTTLTLALPKAGQLRPSHKDELYVGDIGIPPTVYPLVGVPEPRLFRNGRLARIR